jgi:RNA recognition motif-containing protein
MKIYVGNLSFSINSSSLEKIFSEYGVVESAEIINDRSTGRSKGFAFVEMPNDDEGNAAIEALNGKEIEERAIMVNKARPKTTTGGGRGGGGRGGGGYGGGGGGRGGGGGGRGGGGFGGGGRGGGGFGGGGRGGRGRGE